MDIQTKKNMLYVFTFGYLIIVGQEIYKVAYQNHSITGAILLILLTSFGYGITNLILNHDINKFEKWKKQATEFTGEVQGTVSDISLSSTRENGRNTVIISATYNNFELSFGGLHPDYQFKYRIGDSIDLFIHPIDEQQFVLKDLK